MNQSLLIPLLLAMSIPASAQPRSFDIELLIFKRNEGSNASLERWPESKQPDILNSDELLKQIEDHCQLDASDCSENRPNQPVQPNAISTPAKGRYMLSHGQLRMNYLRKKLAKHSEYTPLLHVGWREEVKSPRSAHFVHLFGGDNFSYQFDQQGNLIAEGATEDEPMPKGISVSSESTEVSVNAPLKKAAPKALWELDGVLQVSLNHYLYVDFDMLLRNVDERAVVLKPQAPSDQKAVTAEGGTETEEPNLIIEENTTSNDFAFSSESPDTEEYLQGFNFKQKRRLKSGETHYFDHPKFGMILQIRKLKEKSNKVDQ